MFLCSPRTIWKESLVYPQLMILHDWPEQSNSTVVPQTFLLAEKQIQQFFPISGCRTSQKTEIREITWTGNIPHFQNLHLTSSFASKTNVWWAVTLINLVKFLWSKWPCWFIWKTTLPTCNSVLNCLISSNRRTTRPWSYCTSPGWSYCASCLSVSVATHTRSGQWSLNLRFWVSVTATVTMATIDVRLDPDSKQLFFFFPLSPLFS